MKTSRKKFFYGYVIVCSSSQKWALMVGPRAIGGFYKQL